MQYAPTAPVATTLIGGSGNDRLNGGVGDSTLIAGSGNDDLSSNGTGSNVFVFGPGNDSATSAGADSNDVYRLGGGDGSNTIDDRGGEDRIELGEGIGEADVFLRRDASGHLILTLDTGESLRVKHMFNSSTGALNAARAIEVIRFADGTEWDIDRMLDLVEED